MRHLARTIAAAFAIAYVGAAFPVHAAATTMLPPEKTAAGIAYRTGGIGKEEAAAMKQAESRYPLVLEFVGKPVVRGLNAEYLADVRVTIADAKDGKSVLSTTAAGPFLMAKVAPGKYTVTAQYQGKTQHRTIEVRAKQTERVMFEWNA